MTTSQSAAEAQTLNTVPINDTNPESESTLIPQLSVQANFRWTLAGNVVNATSQWGMLFVLARLGNAVVVGQFVLGLAIAAPIMALTMLQLRHIQITDARQEYAFADYFGMRIFWAAIGMAAIVAWTYLGDFEQQTVWVVLGVGLTKCIDSISDIVRGLFQRCERMDYSGMSLMLRGPGALGAMAILMWWTGDIVMAVAAMAAVWAGAFVFYDIVQARRLLAAIPQHDQLHQRLRPRFARGVMVRLTWLAFPLGIVMALISLQTNVPRYVLDGFAGEAALGYFGAMAYPIMAGMMVVGAMGQAASPRMARNFLDNIDGYRASLRKLLLLAVGLGVLLVAATALLGRQFLALYGPGYTEYLQEFVVLAIAAAIQMIASCFGYALTAARVFRTQVALTVASCLATALAAYLLIPHWGVMGAAATVLVTAVAMATTFAVTIRWAIRKQPRVSGGDRHSVNHSNGS